MQIQWSWVFKQWVALKPTGETFRCDGNPACLFCKGPEIKFESMAIFSCAG